MSVFKAYDIRGIYGEQLDEALAERIGAAFVDVLGGGPVVVGRDMRDCAPSIAAAFIKGARMRGADVIDIGLASTPMTYFAIGHLEANGGVQITASHNPSEYIGMKFCRKGCVPVSYDTGIDRIEAAANGEFPTAFAQSGGLTDRDVMADYVEHVASFSDGPCRLKIVADAGNGMAGLTLPKIDERLGLGMEALYFELDGTFPNHEANPLVRENLIDVCNRVKETGADLGLAFDGDADRCAFIDETGMPVPNDIMTAIIAREVLTKNGGGACVFDLRSSRVLAEEIEKAGGRPIKERVGHSFIKKTMRDHDAIVGGELSGHYYFRDNYTSDSGVIAMVVVLNILQREGKKLSELAAPLLKYPNTGEVNFEVEDKDGMIAELGKIFADAEVDHLDGITVSYPTWWFNVRKSNTEPLLRLSLEADDDDTLATARARLFAILGEPVVGH